MKNSCFLILFFCLSLFSRDLIAQNLTHVTVMGPSSTYVGEDESFYVSFWDGASQVNYPGGTYYWDFTGSQVNSMDPVSLSLHFTSAGNEYVAYTYVTFDDLIWDQWDFVVYSDYCQNITPTAIENTPESPGQVTLTSNTAPPGFTYEWYDATGINLLSTSQSFTTPEINETTVFKLAFRYTSTGCLTEKVNVTAHIKSENFIKTYSPISPVSEESIAIDGGNSVSLKNFVYFDGLGRPIQQNQVNFSPLGSDKITPINYDDFGRQIKNYLPYTIDNGQGSGELRDQALFEQETFYNNFFGENAGDYSFAENIVEPSPLNRVMESYSPGDPWSRMGANGGKPIVIDYLTNVPTDSVMIWDVVEGKLAVAGFYPSGKLFKTVTTDEEGHQIQEFKDLQDRVILKNVQAPQGKWAQTYYVYDVFGNLIYVLPPEAVLAYYTSDPEQPAGYYLVTDDQNYEDISSGSGGMIAYLPPGSITVNPGTTLSGNIEILPAKDIRSQEFIDLWAFQYTYDGRQRLIEKKMPGAAPVMMVYDKRDRLVLTQDGNQRLLNKWSFIKYDALDRPIITGEKVINGELATIRDMVDSQTIFGETYTGTGITQYSDNSYPSSILESEIHTITYFDNYEFTTKSFSAPSILENNVNGKIEPIAFGAVRGQVTGTKIKILGTDSDYIETVNFYDDRYRIIQSIILNHKGGEDVISTQYDFIGRVRMTHLVHQNPSSVINSGEIVQEYIYDHAGRLLSVTHQIENEPAVVLISNTYNELGELVNKDLADSYEDIDYHYNIRGWLTSINNLSDGVDKFFEMELEYNNAPVGHQVYNGNIGATTWKNPYESLINRYDYTYDEMNRLNEADYSNGGASSMGFDVSSISYDLNGNIQTLDRKGNDELNNPNVFIDQLSYSYQAGNQLSKVMDASGKSTGFKDSVDLEIEYLYDPNGNMVKDLNKGIDTIEYNFLNLPNKVIFEGGNYLENTYDASGNKLSTTLVEGQIVKVSDYLGGFVYEDNELQFFQHEEGRVVVKRDDSGVLEGFQYQYHLKDHLGSIRVTFKTEVDDPDFYLATFENDASSITYEETYFSRYGEITRINANIFDHTDTQKKKTYSMRLNGSGNEIYGLAKSLEVMPGDVVSAEVWAKYIDPSNTGSAGSAFAQLIQDLSTNASNVVVDAISPGSETIPTFIGLLGGNGSQNAGAPLAYINMMVFDKNFQQIGNTLFQQISTLAEEDGSNVSHEYLSISPVTITEPGYVYIYLSNENGTPVEVFFDDFKVTHQTSDIVQKDDYYPFGLTFNSYTSGTENLYKYSGKEEQQEWAVYDFGARMYDPAIGRFGSIDPLADLYVDLTPYNYVANNPMLLIDPDGMEIVNGAEEKRKKAQERYEQKQKDVEAAESKYGTKKEDFESKADFKNYKSDKREMRQAKRDVANYTRDSDATQKLIDNLKENSPNMFNELDNLKNEYGQTVDVYISSTSNVTGPNDGATIHRFSLDSKGNIFPSTTQYGRNTIEVEISNSPSGGRSTLTVTKHEMGHTSYQGSNTSSYYKYLKNTGKLGKLYDGHASDDPSGKRALKYQNLNDIEK